MKNKGLLIGIIALAVLVVGYFVWKGNDSESVANRPEIEIGVIMPLTGPVAEPGKNALKGIKLAVEHHNKESDTKIRLLIEDSRSSPKDGVSAMNKLVAEGVQVVIGDIMSSVFLACAPIAEQNKVIMFSPGASAPSVRDAGDYIFRNYLSDDFDGKVMAEYIYEQGLKRVGVISVNNDYGIGVSRTFKQSFKGELVFHEQYSQGQTDFRTLISKVRSKEVEALYLVCNPVESGQLVVQLKEHGYLPKLFGNLSFENKEFIDVAMGSFDQVTFSAPYFNLDADSYLTKKFVEGYSKKHKVKPDVAAALGYDVILILSDLIQRGNVHSDSFKNGLYKMKDFEAVTGRSTFDENGDVLKAISIKRIGENGKIQELELFEIEK